VRTIVTHVSPDWDALTAAWLLKRYAGGFQDAEVVLVNTGQPDPAILSSADAVVDTGKEFNPSRLRFDHHQWANNETSATQLVWEWLCEAEHYLPRLRPLIELVTAGDLGRSSARWSRERGIHAVLSSWKAQKMTDDVLLERGFALLDEIAGLLGSHDLDTSIQAALIPYAVDIQAHQEAAQRAQETLEQHTVYRSADGLLVALENAPQGASQAAFDAGARLVVFHTDYPDVPIVAVGVQRAGEWTEPHIGRLVEYILYSAAQQNGSHGPEYVGPELATWYQHPVGFFSGRGTPKAPDARPLEVKLDAIARVIDESWLR
jgi:hypothetical protein